MDNNELSTILREWFDNHGLIESIGQRDEYYRCHACKKGAWLRNEIKHTDDCLLVRTEKALHPLQVVETRQRELSAPTKRVLDRMARYQQYWRGKDQAYWLARLMQEVGECASAFAGDHSDPIDHELEQIASIALNWLGLLDEIRRPFHVGDPDA